MKQGRFEKTYNDLLDCYLFISLGDESDREIVFRSKLISLCKEVAQNDDIQQYSNSVEIENENLSRNQ